jgi:hypothetical protein
LHAPAVYAVHAAHAAVGLSDREAVEPVGQAAAGPSAHRIIGLTGLTGPIGLTGPSVYEIVGLSEVSGVGSVLAADPCEKSARWIVRLLNRRTIGLVAHEVIELSTVLGALRSSGSRLRGYGRVDYRFSNNFPCMSVISVCLNWAQPTLLD